MHTGHYCVKRNRGIQNRRTVRYYQNYYTLARILKKSRYKPQGLSENGALGFPGSEGVAVTSSV